MNFSVSVTPSSVEAEPVAFSGRNLLADWWY